MGHLTLKPKYLVLRKSENLSSAAKSAEVVVGGN